VSLISKKSFILDDEDDNLKLKPYTLPKLVTTKPEVIPLGISVTGSCFLHIFVPFMIWLISLLYTF
jgi:hypothetical protein